MQGENMLTVWTLCISAPLIVVRLLKLIGWLRTGRENADHMDFERSGPCHTHTSLCKLTNWDAGFIIPL